MEIRELKRTAGELPNTDELLGRFVTDGLTALRCTTEKVSVLSKPLRKRKGTKGDGIFNTAGFGKAAELAALAKELIYSQLVTEKLATLAHALVELSIATAMDDKKGVRRITSLFTNDPYYNLENVRADVELIGLKFALLDEGYKHTIEEIAGQMPLEQRIAFLGSGGSNKCGGNALKEVGGVVRKQKELLEGIRGHFLRLTRGTQYWENAERSGK